MAALIAAPSSPSPMGSSGFWRLLSVSASSFLSALDSVTRRHLIEDLHRLWAGRAPRPAIVFVTHDVEEAVYLAGRTVVLDAVSGRVVMDRPTPGVLPRAPGWRAAPACREAVEELAAALAHAMPDRVTG